VVSIVGLGYVSLPLLIAAFRAGWVVNGIDSDNSKVERLTQSLSHIEDVSNVELRDAVNSGKVSFTCNAEEISKSDIVIFCLPTPTRNDEPDLSILLGAIEEYAPYFRNDALIVSESSSFPGTLRDKIKPICEAVRGNKRFHYGHSPERVDPGNKTWTNRNTPRIISTIDPDSMHKMREFYGSICDHLVEVDSPEIAEAAKMFENSFRQVNIALVNEFTRYCNKVGLSASKVLNAASTKPFGFMKFNYGIGVGGHCIPVDPHYLVNHAERNGSKLEIIEVSNKVNQEQPRYVLSQIKQLLGARFRESRVLVVGLSYKANTSDLRESPSLELLELLDEEGIQVFWYDPMCNQEIKHPLGKPQEKYDLAVVTVLHNAYEYSEILNACAQILDCTQKILATTNVRYL